MENDFGSSFNHRCLDLESALLSSSGAQLPDLVKGNSFSAYMNPQFNEFLTSNGNGDFPLFAFSAVPQAMAGQTYEPRNWSCFPQDVSPFPAEMIHAGSVENIGGIGNFNPGPKKLVVFDKFDDRTALVYSSANCTPTQCRESLSPKPLAGYNLIKEHPRVNQNEMLSPLGNSIDDGYFEENNERDVESEWREDTDELNALIYCDKDSDCSEDDEVTSTGRSPSTMTVQDKPAEWFEETGEEVESSGPTKRRKLIDGGKPYPCSDVLSFVHTATPGKPYPSSELEDDAESSCNEASSALSAGSKRSRKEKIRNTISVLQMIIPGVKGKDAMIVIDEAIRCLRSLKAEAKSLGLDDL